jgi:iron complex outermembrane receptor protein
MELSVAIQPLRAVRFTGSYSYFDLDITRDADSRDVSNGVSEANDPHHLLSIRAAIDLSPAIEADAWLRHVSALPNPAVPSYTELNARIGWRATSSVQLALIGQDLLNGSHPEFGSTVPARVEFERSVRVALTFSRH